MDLLSQTQIDVLNDYLYRNFVDLFTQPTPELRNNVNDVFPETETCYNNHEDYIECVQSFQTVGPVESIALSLGSSLSNTIKAKCEILSTGSSAAGVVVPEFVFGENRNYIETYDSDADIMFCVTFADVFKWCIQQEEHECGSQYEKLDIEHEHDNYKQLVNNIDNGKYELSSDKYPLEQYPEHGVKQQCGDETATTAGGLSDLVFLDKTQEGQVQEIPMPTPVLEDSKEHPGFVVLKLTPGLMEILPQRLIAQPGTVYKKDDVSFLKQLFEKRYSNCTHNKHCEIIMKPRFFLSSVEMILMITSKTTKFKLEDPNDNSVEILDIERFITFTITGPSIQTVIDLTKFKIDVMSNIVSASGPIASRPIGDNNKDNRNNTIDSGNDDGDDDDDYSSKSEILLNEPFQKYKDMDIVPALAFNGWPMVAIPWLHRRRKWPPEHLVNIIKESGFHLVTVTPKVGDNIENLWRLSFSRAELLLLTALPKYSWCKQTYRIFKWLIKSSMHKPSGVLPSYYLLTLFFWTLEEYPPDIWTSKSLAEFVLMLLEKLIECVCQRYLEHYFIPGCNIMANMTPDNRRTVLKMLVTVRKNPLRFFYQPYVTPWDEALTGISIEDMLAWGEDS